jgi:aminoglycoside phosphotransferase (APT) family kinase protein
MVAATVRLRWDRRRRRSELRQLVPLIVHAAPAALGEVGPEYMIERAHVTSTGVAVIVIAAYDGSARVVVKLPMTAQALTALDAETRMLVGLHADGRLGDWRRVLPEPRAFGSVRGCRFRVDSALPGRAVPERPDHAAAGDLLVDAAAQRIHHLHAATAVSAKADDALVEHWIDDPVRSLTDAMWYMQGAADQLQRVRNELHRAVEGQTFWAGAIHGDYWLGNMLFSGSELTGIVDWDTGGTAEFAAIDILHLLLYRRCVATGQELGEVVSQQLAAPRWSGQEQRLLETHGGFGGDGSPAPRAALLLYWLRHVVRHVRQTPAPGGIGERLWERRNVRPVLEAASRGSKR